MLVHKHLIVRAEVERAPSNRIWVEEWLKNLVEKIGMKVCAGPSQSMLICLAIVVLLQL